MAVGQQYDLEHDAWVVGARAHFIVLEFGIHGREIKFMIDKIVQCECETSRYQLLGQNHR